MSSSTHQPAASAAADGGGGSGNDIRNWLLYYYSLSQSVLNLGAIEPTTTTIQQEQEESEQEEEVSEALKGDTTPPSPSPIHGRRPSSVRFLESVSVRRLQVPLEYDDDDQAVNDSDLYYTREDIQAFKHDHEQEKLLQQEAQRKQAKRRERLERKLRLAQRKAHRERELLQQQQQQQQATTTSSTSSSSATIMSSMGTTNPSRPCSSNLVLAGGFLPTLQSSPSIG